MFKEGDRDLRRWRCISLKDLLAKLDELDREAKEVIAEADEAIEVSNETLALLKSIKFTPIIRHLN